MSEPEVTMLSTFEENATPPNFAFAALNAKLCVEIILSLARAGELQAKVNVELNDGKNSVVVNGDFTP